MDSCSADDVVIHMETLGEAFKSESDEPSDSEEYFELQEDDVLESLKKDPNFIETTMETCGTDLPVLHAAALQGFDRVVTYVLAADPRQIKRVHCGRTALHFASQSSCKKVVELLLAAEPTLINAVTPDGSTALHFVAKRCASDDSRAIIELLLAADSTLINAVASNGFTALHSAAQSRDYPTLCCRNTHEVIELLLTAAPMLINAVTPDGYTALHVAAQSGNITAMKLFTTDGRSAGLIDAVTNNGETVLHLAAFNGKNSMVEYLLDLKPALIDVVTNTGETALLSAGSGYSLPLPVVETLLAKPDLISMKDNEGTTFLHKVAEHCRSKELIEKLWRLHPEALRADNFVLDTPFHVAIDEKNDAAIEVFQWALTWEEIVAAYVECCKDYASFVSSCLDRFRPVIEKQCESLSLWLLPDVVGTVFEYLDFERKKHTPANAE